MKLQKLSLYMEISCFSAFVVFDIVATKINSLFFLYSYYIDTEEKSKQNILTGVDNYDTIMIPLVTKG